MVVDNKGEVLGRGMRCMVVQDEKMGTEEGDTCLEAGKLNLDGWEKNELFG